MASISIDESSLPSQQGKVTVITGGASGIGLATAKILASQGAQVYVLDLNLPATPQDQHIPNIKFLKCDVANWAQLRQSFQHIGHVDLAFANAGISETTNCFDDTFDAQGWLQEPERPVIDVNFRAVVYFIKLAYSAMKRSKTAGSIVITTSATAYAPEQSLPIYAATKFALVGLIRALRSTLIRSNITLNGVAPAATITALLPHSLARPIIAAGLPVSSAHFVALALVYSASATENHRVQAYGKEEEGEDARGGRWNGRVILTLGERYTELEEPVGRLRGEWFGRENLEDTRKQQAATDFRGVGDVNGHC